MAARFRVDWPETLTAVAVCAVFAVGAVVWTGAVIDRTSATHTPPPRTTLAPCTTEDDPGPCYWDATRHGNGHGRSFVTIDEHVYLLPESE